MTSEQATTRQFQARVPRALLVAMLVATLVLLGTGIMWLYYAVQLWRFARTEAILLLLLGVAFLIEVLYGIYTIPRMLAREKTASVTMNATGIAINGGHGEVREIVWDQIQQLRVINASQTFWPYRMSIVVDGERIGFPQWLKNEDGLADEIRSRAGLDEISQSWWRTCFTRPTDEGSAGVQEGSL